MDADSIAWKILSLQHHVVDFKNLLLIKFEQNAN